eukprot:2109093-Prymnesium_polylepis.1
MYTIYYRKPFIVGESDIRHTTLVRVMRQLIKLRLLLSSDIQSRAVGTIYLIRLYVATFAIFAA